MKQDLQAVRVDGFGGGMEWNLEKRERSFFVTYLFVGSRTPEAVEASPYEGWNLHYPKALGPQGQADAFLFVRRIPTPPLVGRQGIRASGLSLAVEWRTWPIMCPY